MLKIANLKKSYGSFQLNCSLEVPTGYITGLIGTNGAGKSTTIKAILGLIAIESGKIELFGREIKRITEKEKERLGVVLSDSGFSNFLTIKDIMAILCALYFRFDRERFLDYCVRYQLPLQKPIKEFSTGMKAKLKIFIAVSHGADLLLLDEPTTGLDVMAREDLRDILREYMEEDENRSILISSHISSDLENLCDDLYLMDKGKVVLHEEMDTLLNKYALLKVTEEEYEALDRQYLLRVSRESYGYACLTDQKQFYMENYPMIAIENGTIDHVTSLMVRGEKR